MKKRISNLSRIRNGIIRKIKGSKLREEIIDANNVKRSSERSRCCTVIVIKSSNSSSQILLAVSVNLEENNIIEGPKLQKSAETLKVAKVAEAPYRQQSQ